MFRLHRRDRIEGMTLQKSKKKEEKTVDGLVCGYVGFRIMSCTSLGVILELKMYFETYCGSLWAPWVAIMALVWKVRKMTHKKAQQGAETSCVPAILWSLKDY